MYSARAELFSLTSAVLVRLFVSRATPEGALSEARARVHTNTHMHVHAYTRTHTQLTGPLSLELALIMRNGRVTCHTA